MVATRRIRSETSAVGFSGFSTALPVNPLVFVGGRPCTQHLHLPERPNSSCIISALKRSASQIRLPNVHWKQDCRCIGRELVIQVRVLHGWNLCTNEKVQPEYPFGILICQTMLRINCQRNEVGQQLGVARTDRAIGQLRFCGPVTR